MMRIKVMGAIVLMVAASLCIPLGAVSAVHVSDPTQVLKVDQVYTIEGNETWLGVSITSTGTLVVPRGTTLEARYIKINGGGFEVNGGTVLLGNAPDGQDAYIALGPGRTGTASSFNLLNGARLVLRAPNGSNILETSQGGDAAIDVKVIESVTIKSASIECYGGIGYSNPEVWVDHANLIGYYAAGGNGTVKIGTRDTPSMSISDLTVTLVGGNGGRAANGKPPNGFKGGMGGGYANNGTVGDHVGAGGMGIMYFGARDLDVTNLVASATGGKGGRAGDGGGLDSDITRQVGSGGGGGYSGGNGGDWSAGGAARAESGGIVKDYVGSGGMIDFDFDANNLSVDGFEMTASSGRGGDAGKGAPGSYYCGGGGGGYGGGGGTYSNGGSTSSRGGNGDVRNNVGAGGNIITNFIGENQLNASNINITALAGQGGIAGTGGIGGGTPGGSTGYGGGGGAGFAGGGGGGYWDSGGSGFLSGDVGSGGNSNVTFSGGPMTLVDSLILLFGGQGGLGGAGGRGGCNAGGGGGGYGGGGGNGYGISGVGPGAGTVSDNVGRGGKAYLLMSSASNPGQLVARHNKLYLQGGMGGDGGAGGLQGFNSGGGGGGYCGCGGRYTSGYAPPAAAPVGKFVGCGGNAEITVSHAAPSISKDNSVTLLGGKAGNGKTQAGLGNVGGTGLGSKTTAGDPVSNIPMGVVSIVSPKPGEVVNAIPPTFEWDPVMYSSTDGDIISYSIQIDQSPDFPMPAVDTGVELRTSFSPTSELVGGGVYYWRVMATYMTGNSYGWGPTQQFSFNTPPILKRSIPLHSFKEDTTATHLINLTNYFQDDLFTDTLEYSIINETAPSHILSIVDGNFLTFTTPTKDWYGQERFAVRGMDPLGLWVNSNTFTIRVTPVNDPPVLLNLPAIIVTEGEEHFVDLSPYVYDPDSKLTEMIVQTSSPYCHADGLQLTFNYTPGLGMTSDTVAINLSDGFDYTIMPVNLTIEKYNNPPQITAPIPWVLSVTEDTEFTMSLVDYASDLETGATDIVWNVTAISAGNPPVFSAFIVGRSTLKIVPATDANGGGSFVLVAVDKGGKEDSRTVSVGIVAVNDPPVIAHLPDLKIVAGNYVVIDLTKYVSDIDNPLSDLKLTSASPLANVEGLKMTIFVKADSAENQDIVPITISDGTDTATSEFLVKIVFPPSIPQVIQPLKLTVGKVKTIALADYVYDKDTREEALNWELTGVNEKYFTASIDPNTHILKITPKAAGKGMLTLTVRDPDGGSSMQMVPLTIKTEGEKPMVIPTGIYVLIAFVVVAAVVGISLLAMRRRG